MQIFFLARDSQENIYAMQRSIWVCKEKVFVLVEGREDYFLAKGKSVS